MLSSVGHLPNEFVCPRDRGVHVFDQPCDIGLDFGGFAAESSDGLSIEGMLEGQHIIVELVETDVGAATRDLNV